MGEKRAFSAWIEQLGANGEVIRVRCAPAGKYLARVVPHGGRSWRVERREPGAWVPLRGAPRGPYSSRPIRLWRSPYAAMDAFERERSATKDGGTDG